MKTLPFKDAICSAVIIFIQTSLRLKKNLGQFLYQFREKTKQLTILVSLVFGMKNFKNQRGLFNLNILEK